jgi:hypothetical protein
VKQRGSENENKLRGFSLTFTGNAQTQSSVLCVSFAPLCKSSPKSGAVANKAPMHSISSTGSRARHLDSFSLIGC